ncbi:tetratricopeptide repeat protein [Vicingaceae bacterium]|jgi:tetratricopeptide (TPR) repeat protein|nr:tetratricopeptide repeat protein [Vicingaceae bacterium]
MDRIDQITEMLAKDPSDDFLHYALALEYDKKGEIEKAISIITNLLKSSPEYLGSYYKLGQLFEEKGQIANAIEIYKKGILLADEKNDNKAKGELNEALWLIEDID